MKWKKNPFDDCNHFFPSFFNSFNVRTFERSLYDHQWASTLANVASYCLWLLRQYYRTILMVFSMCEASCLPLQNFAHSTLCVIRGGSSNSARTDTHILANSHVCTMNGADAQVRFGRRSSIGTQSAWPRTTKTIDALAPTHNTHKHTTTHCAIVTKATTTKERR